MEMGDSLLISSPLMMVRNALGVRANPPPDLNKNTEWFHYPGVWSSYILLVFIGWLFVLSPPFFVDLTSFHPNQAMFVSDIVEC